MKRGRGGGCRKTLGRLMALRTQRPSRQHPFMLAKVLPGLEAADKLWAALGQSQVLQPWRPHLGGIRSSPGYGHHYG